MAFGLKTSNSRAEPLIGAPLLLRSGATSSRGSRKGVSVSAQIIDRGKVPR